MAFSLPSHAHVINVAIILVFGASMVDIRFNKEIRSNIKCVSSALIELFSLCDSLLPVLVTGSVAGWLQKFLDFGFSPVPSAASSNSPSRSSWRKYGEANIKFGSGHLFFVIVASCHVQCN